MSRDFFWRPIPKDPEPSGVVSYSMWILLESHFGTVFGEHDREMIRLDKDSREYLRGLADGSGPLAKEATRLIGALSANQDGIEIGYTT